MELNEVKKALYKQKPTAKYVHTTKHKVKGDIWVYRCDLDDNEVIFHVPVSEMGVEVFEKEIAGQLLIRWISAYGSK